MNLPKFEELADPGANGACSRYEVAQLHCLRSIAVSLESIAIMLSLDDSISDDAYGNMKAEVNAHSVAKGDDK